MDFTCTAVELELSQFASSAAPASSVVADWFWLDWESLTSSNGFDSTIFESCKFQRETKLGVPWQLKSRLDATLRTLLTQSCSSLPLTGKSLTEIELNWFIDFEKVISLPTHYSLLRNRANLFGKHVQTCFARFSADT